MVTEGILPQSPETGTHTRARLGLITNPIKCRMLVQTDSNFSLVFTAGALSHIQNEHHYTSDGPHTAAASMNGTCDVECDSVYKKDLLTAYKAGLVSVKQLAGASRRTAPRPLLALDMQPSAQRGPMQSHMLPCSLGITML